MSESAVERDHDQAQKLIPLIKLVILISSGIRFLYR